MVIHHPTNSFTHPKGVLTCLLINRYICFPEPYIFTMIHTAIIEDVEEIRDAMALLIGNAEGFSCNHVYNSTEEAIRCMPGNNIDVVVVDINLPGKSGIECVKELVPKMPHTQFMMFTVYDDSENIFNALAAGASGYILKQTLPEQIIEAIRELHNGGAPMSSDIARRVVAAFQVKEKNAGQADLLSTRELEILAMLSKGYLYKEISGRLGISANTVKTHIHNIYDKLHVQNRMEAVNKVFGQRRG